MNSGESCKTGETLEIFGMIVSYPWFLPCRARQRVPNVSQFTGKNMELDGLDF